MRSYECQLLGNCPLYNENMFPLYYNFGDRYDFENGFEAILENGLTTSSAHTASIDFVDTDKGMAGQVLTILGSGFLNNLPVTDTNYYKNMWGFFNQRPTMQTYIGDRPCRTDYFNDTFLNCTAFYDKSGR